MPFQGERAIVYITLLGSLYNLYYFLSSDFLSSLIFGPVTDIQTDRIRCIRAHRAYAQVGSKSDD